MPRRIAGLAGAVQALSAACAVALVLTHTIAADSTECQRTHIRAMDTRAADAIAFGIARSAAFRELVDDISKSDLIVYVGTQFEMAFPLNGEIHFVTSSGDHRYMRVLVRGEMSPWDRAALVGHELQHAREVAEAPEVRDTAGMDALYHRIGYGVGIDRHETDAARAVTVRILQELTPGNATATTR